MKQLNNTTSERVDDLPVIVHWLSQMQIQFLLDQKLPTPHGNRQGLSYGQLAVLLLTYILTQAPSQTLCSGIMGTPASSNFRNGNRMVHSG